MELLELISGLLEGLELMRFWRCILSLFISALLSYALHSVLLAPAGLISAIILMTTGFILGIYLEYRIRQNP